MKLSNEVLSELLELEELIKPLKHRIEEIRTAIKDKGTFITSEYAVTVKPGLREYMASVDECSTKIGLEKLKIYGLIKVSCFKTVSVCKREPKVKPLDV